MVDTPERDKTHVTFGMRSDSLDPGDISLRLGLTPTFACAKGERVRVGRKRVERGFPHGVWQLLTIPQVLSDDLEEHARYLLSQLEPVQMAIERYVRDPTFYVYISFWWLTDGCVGGYTLSGDTVRRLAVLCQEFNFTFVGNSESGTV
jgi:hypothetical protein